ncbi:MAG: hypothetical protein LC745_07795, partial [Planctomycetia bacterium]|nr:hypothetical protein [Planctomycetia bacterium]
MTRPHDGDPAIPSLIHALRVAPDCVATRMALADALQDAEASPVRLGHVPRWLTQAWRRANPLVRGGR